MNAVRLSRHERFDAGAHFADLDGLALQRVVEALVEEVPGKRIFGHPHWLQADIARKGDLHKYITSLSVFFLVSCMQLPIQVLKAIVHE